MPVQESDNPFLSKLAVGIRRCAVLDCRIVVAVSGGADSVALLRGLAQIGSSFRLDLLIAHVNHQLRGTASDSDESWVRRLSEETGVDCCVRKVDVTGRAEERSQSIEEAARDARYEVLSEIAAAADAAGIATAHSADDQVETILHHVIRGTGLAGLRGMQPVRQLDIGVNLIRPMLQITRLEIEQWLASIGQEFRTDQSNRDSTFTRNRIRRELLPMLESEFNPQVRKALTALSLQGSEAFQFIRLHAERLASEILEQASADSLRINCRDLDAYERIIVREALHVLWQQSGWPLKHMGFQEWERLAEIALSGGAATLPRRIDARRRGALLVITRNESPHSDEANT